LKARLVAGPVRGLWPSGGRRRSLVAPWRDGRKERVALPIVQDLLGARDEVDDGEEGLAEEAKNAQEDPRGQPGPRVGAASLCVAMDQDSDGDGNDNDDEGGNEECYNEGGVVSGALEQHGHKRVSHGRASFGLAR